MLCTSSRSYHRSENAEIVLCRVRTKKQRKKWTYGVFASAFFGVLNKRSPRFDGGPRAESIDFAAGSVVTAGAFVTGIGIFAGAGSFAVALTDPTGTAALPNCNDFLLASGPFADF